NPGFVVTLAPLDGDRDPLAIAVVVAMAVALIDGVAGVGDQVHEDLLDLLSATADPRGPITKRHGEGDVIFAEHALDQRERGLDQLADLDDLLLLFGLLAR